MKTSAALIKTRARLGQLGGYGIEASRATRMSASTEGPDALLIGKDGRVWLAGIWGGDDVQPLLVADENSSLETRVQRLWDWRERIGSGWGYPLPGLIILAPGLSSETTSRVLSGEIVPVFERGTCERSATLAEAILASVAPVLPSDVLVRWRAAAVPEVAIESRRKRVIRIPSVLVAPMLLDYKQERCVRLDLEDEALAKPLGADLRLRVITGVAGCGKTLVLVHRAVRLAIFFPQKRIVLLSFNRPLTNELKRRLARDPVAAPVECLTFNQWLHQIAPPRGEMMSGAELLRWIDRERPSFPALAKHSSEWLLEEMHWMLDHALVTTDYLNAPRKGRGTRLNLTQRRAILDLLIRFRAYLRENGRADWAEWPLSVQENPPEALTRRRIDHLLIDEAQFFAPVWLDLLRTALQPGGHVFLCADPTQGFLRRGTSWAALGIEARSRSLRLEKPYRSTRAILEFAREFYRHRLPNDEEPLDLPDPEALATLKPGVRPIVYPGGSGQDQMERIAKELHELRSGGVPAEDVLILIAGRSCTVESMVRYLNSRLAPGSAASVKDPTASQDSIGVAHLMAATGLERPIVFLLGLDELVAEENNPLLSPDERAEKVQANTRQVYVGLTRAMDRMVIYASHPNLTTAFVDSAGLRLQRPP